MARNVFENTWPVSYYASKSHIYYFILKNVLINSMAYIFLIKKRKEQKNFVVL